MARTPLRTPKVFCVGFQKTGTSSLGRAGTQLGYRVTGPDGTSDARIGENALDLAMRLAPRFDFFQDNPWPVLYREMDEAFPGSKFILTTRDSASWIGSMKKHFAGTDRPMLRWLYGAPDPAGNEQSFIRTYESHNQAVLSYFEGRESFLHLDIFADPTWKRLADFLEVEAPTELLPHANSASSRNPRWGQSSLVRHARELKRRIRRNL